MQIKRLRSNIFLPMFPEESARLTIDKMLTEAGWVVQNSQDADLGAGIGVAIREFSFSSGAADYALFVDRKPVGVVEAKPEGTTLSAVFGQARGYAEGQPKYFELSQALPFIYVSTGIETHFCDLRDPDARSRRLFAFHKPEMLLSWAEEPITLRERLRLMPPLIEEGLRECQIDAVTSLEESFFANQPRSLLQMATGSGKTFTAVTAAYRLIKHAGAKRILFLVDRNTLARQTKLEFEQYDTPDDGRKFTSLFNVQHLQSNSLDPASKVCITTIQRLYSMLRGDAEYEPGNEDAPLSRIKLDRPIDVSYNPAIPIETFDFIVTDECHRSIYNVWRQVLEYFDSFLVGLTATPSKQTLGYFKQNLVTEYSHEKAVADGVNVVYDVFRIKTRVGEQGGEVEAGFYVDIRERATRRIRQELLDEDLTFEAKQLDRSVVVPDQIRTVLKTYKDNLPVLFPERTNVPKTLIFAKDDSHAEDITGIVKEVFGKGDDFCKKITYQAQSPETLIEQFRSEFLPRIAVTVDMISTGTDIKSLECLVFLRDVRSQVYFEQMKGRGTRTIDRTDLQSASGEEATEKTHFLIVDAVGVCESDKSDSRPLERKRTVPFGTLIDSLQYKRDEDTISSLAGRLARLDRQLEETEKAEIEQAANGKSLNELVRGLFNAINPDEQETKAKELFNTEEPTGEQMKAAFTELAKEFCGPFDNPNLRNTIKNIKQRNEQTIAPSVTDELLSVGFDDTAIQEAARNHVDRFKRFIEENRDEITALQIIFSQPYGQRRLTYQMIDELAQALDRPPYNIAPKAVWNAYSVIEKSKVKTVPPEKVLANIIALIRFAIGETQTLETWEETVNQRFNIWLNQQEESENKFTAEQIEWLEMMRDQIAISVEMRIEDLQENPFRDKGGVFGAARAFNNDYGKIEAVMNDLNQALAA